MTTRCPRCSGRVFREPALPRDVAQYVCVNCGHRADVAPTPPLPLLHLPAPVTVRPCDHCGHAFRPTRPSGRYCSRACAYAYAAVTDHRALFAAHGAAGHVGARERAATIRAERVAKLKVWLAADPTLDRATLAARLDVSIRVVMRLCTTALPPEQWPWQRRPRRLRQQEVA